MKCLKYSLLLFISLLHLLGSVTPSSSVTSPFALKERKKHINVWSRKEREEERDRDRERGGGGGREREGETQREGETETDTDTDRETWRVTEHYTNITENLYQAWDWPCFKFHRHINLIRAPTNRQKTVILKYHLSTINNSGGGGW